MDLTVHCICTGGIHIFLILHCTYFLRPNSNRSVLCFKISLVWRKKIDVSQKKEPSAGIVQTPSYSTGKECGESSFLYGKLY